MKDQIKKSTRGQVSIAAMIGIGTSIIMSVAGGYFFQSQRTDEKIGAVSERTARLEEAVLRIKEDNAETRKDIKEFLIQLNKKK